MADMDISPVFGMYLTALIDTTTITALVASGMVAIAIYVANWKLLKQQKKLNSAELSLKILETWSERKHPKFTGFLDRLECSEVTKDDQDINLFLDEFENIAIFRKEGTLTKTHVWEFFSTNLKQIRGQSGNPGLSE